MHSCLYEGIVTHRRREPVSHQFRYRLFMAYLDLDELPALVGRRGLIGNSKYATRSFLRDDHLFDTSQSLDGEVRQMVRQQTGYTPRGPIRLLTQLRYFGYYMSPLNLFYIFDERDESLESVVAEVNNTPWNERHCYVLWQGNRCEKGGRTGVRYQLCEAPEGPFRQLGPDPFFAKRAPKALLSVDGVQKIAITKPAASAVGYNGSGVDGCRRGLAFAHSKDFHVSPFMGMDIEYCWRLTEPGKDLEVHLANIHDSRPIFEAGLSLQRRELSQRQLRCMTLRYPLMTAQIIGAIYYQALELWWKKCPSYKHPKKLNNSPTRSRRSPRGRDVVFAERAIATARSDERSCDA